MRSGIHSSPFLLNFSTFERYSQWGQGQNGRQLSWERERVQGSVFLKGAQVELNRERVAAGPARQRLCAAAALQSRDTRANSARSVGSSLLRISAANSARASSSSHPNSEKGGGGGGWGKPEGEARASPAVGALGGGGFAALL